MADSPIPSELLNLQLCQQQLQDSVTLEIIVKEKIMADNGRVIVNTGNGKGKTTAALGTAFRAMGYGYKVCVIQFLKGKGDYGERLMAEKIDNLDWYICGKGFVFTKENTQKHKLAAQEGFEIAQEKVQSDMYDLIILDEITYLPHYDFLDVEKIVALIEKRPSRLTMILTGRDADPQLVAVADTVTSMEPIKHAFDQGIKAQKGVEF